MLVFIGKGNESILNFFFKGIGSVAVLSFCVICVKLVLCFDLVQLLYVLRADQLLLHYIVM